MVAYFSSRLTKQIRTAFTAVLLVFCLLGTHWIGLSHSISHGVTQSQAPESKAINQVDTSFSHSSDVCHLFDALSLAGFIPNSAFDHSLIISGALAALVAVNSFTPKLEIASYQSRAPPSLIP
jgi:hypothetical protein